MSTKNGKRRDIIEAAFRALMREGLPSLSYDTVAREAQMSRQLVRYHFAQPADLYVALCDHLAETYRSALIEGIVEIDASKRLSFFLDFYFDLLSDRPKPRDDQAYDALFSLAAGSGAVRGRLRDGYTLLGQVVANEIRIQHPELDKQAADELAFLFASIMYGTWKFVASLGLDEGHKRVARQAMDRLILAYRVGGATAEDVSIWAVAPTG